MLVSASYEVLHLSILFLDNPSDMLFCSSPPHTHAQNKRKNTDTQWCMQKHWSNYFHILNGKFSLKMGCRRQIFDNYFVWLCFLCICILLNTICSFLFDLLSFIEHQLKKLFKGCKALHLVSRLFAFLGVEAQQLNRWVSFLFSWPNTGGILRERHPIPL